MNTTVSAMTVGLRHPRTAPWPMTTLTATMPMVKVVNPYQSNGTISPDLTLLSGVPLISKKLTIAPTIDSQKIERHPRDAATRPPKSAEAPPPPQDPIDQ